MVKTVLILMMMCSFFSVESQERAGNKAPREFIDSRADKTLTIGGLSYVNTITYSSMTFNRILVLTGDGEVIVLKELNRHMPGNSESVAQVSESFNIPSDTKFVGITCTFYDSININGFLEFEGYGQTPVTISNYTQTFWKELSESYGSELWMYLHFYGE